jgi:hypothetical protein
VRLLQGSERERMSKMKESRILMKLKEKINKIIGEI